MRRVEIIDGIWQVLEALKRSGVRDAIRLLLNSTRDESVLKPETLEAFKQYVIAAQGYNGAAAKVASILGFDRLLSVNFWLNKNPETLHDFYFKLSVADEFLPQLAELIRPEATMVALKETSGGSGSESIITLFLPEEPGQHSRPERISEALLGVTSIYEVIATVESIPENTLVVLTCDSGSDKSFDLFGISKVVNGVKEIILSVWDRIVFYREMQVAQRLEVIAASLPVLEKLSAMETQQKVAPEQAELLRRKVLEGINQFVASGATIPEMATRSHMEPRKLMAPEPKLLTSGNIESTEKIKGSSQRRKKGRHPGESA